MTWISWLTLLFRWSIAVRVPQENLSWYSVLNILTKSQVLLCADYMAIFCTKICWYWTEPELLELSENVSGVRFLRHSVVQFC